MIAYIRRFAASAACALVLGGSLAHADTRFDLVATFDAGAMLPAAPLIQGADGNLYGTTTQGGAANAGAIVQITPSGAVTVLYAFTGGDDGASPYGGLVQDGDGSFYGTTSAGGAGGAGTVYRLASGQLTVLYSFTGGIDGASPYGGLTRGLDGAFYGTTSAGGASGAGTIYRVSSGGVFNVLYTFTGANDGGYPYSVVSQGADGSLYGTTFGGGESGGGTIFRLAPGGVLSTLYAFAGGSDGAYPYAGVVLATDGALYGVASQGGVNGQGTVFRLAADGTFSVLHAFVGDTTDGGYPVGGLLQAADGSFYGTSVFGGAAGVGTVFHFTSAGAYEVLYTFTGADDGGYPYAALTQAADGALYGTAAFAGAQGGGTVYRLSAVVSLVSWATPAPVVYGTRLSAAQLDATASVPGTFVYSPPAGTLLHAGSQTLTVTFTPSDTTLPVSTSSVALTVLPATPVITWTPPAAIGYGTPLGSAQLNARANVAGVFVYDPGAGAILDLGTQTLSATFFPSRSDYTTASVSVTIAVNPAVPVITWTPAAMINGAPLGPAQLNAVASTPGTFVYTPAAGTILGLGTQTLTATFTPTDSVDYLPASVSATVNVAAPTASGGGNEHPLRFTPAAGARGLVVAGYVVVADVTYGTVVIGNCSYYTVHSGSGRGGGYKTITTYYNQTCTWDAYGNLLTIQSGAPTAPRPLSINGTQTIYASDPQTGIYAGVDTAIPGGGFVFTPGSHYTWLTPNAYAVIAQAISTVTVTLKSDGDLPLGVASAQASALSGSASVTGTTCTGAVPVGSTCAITVRYDPTRLQSPTGLAYDTLTVHVDADSGPATDWSQRYTIQLTAANTTD